MESWWSCKFRVVILLNIPQLLLITLLAAPTSGGAAPAPYCPKALSSLPNVCNRFRCVHNLTQDSCPPDTFFTHNLTLCGCCPGCARYIGLPVNGSNPDQKCTTTNTFSTRRRTSSCAGAHCPVELPTCMPGLDCDPNSGLCSLPTVTLEPCHQECRYKKTLKRLGLFHWDPECEEDGSYAPKQCKGDAVTGLCFCVDECGARIFGQEFRADAQNMTCSCSRMVSILRKEGKAATLHCTPSGGFEPLQCDSDSSLCYCVGEEGRTNGGVVPAKHWATLPCLTPNITNFLKDGAYLRKCESILAPRSRLIREGVEHGLLIELSPTNCDYDGSYGPKQVLGTRSECVYKNGTRILDYATINGGDMDCRCARDQWLYRLKGKPFSFECAAQVGNYKGHYDFGAWASCVDRDGVAYGDMVPSKYACCLDNTCIPATGARCASQDNPEGYRSCCSWPFGGSCS